VCSHCPPIQTTDYALACNNKKLCVKNANNMQFKQFIAQLMQLKKVKKLITRQPYKLYTVKNLSIRKTT